MVLCVCSIACGVRARTCCWLRVVVVVCVCVSVCGIVGVALPP